MPLWLLPLLIGEVVDLGLSRWLILAGRRERLAVQGDGREGRDTIGFENASFDLYKVGRCVEDASRATLSISQERPGSRLPFRPYNAFADI